MASDVINRDITPFVQIEYDANKRYLKLQASSAIYGTAIIITTTGKCFIGGISNDTAVPVLASGSYGAFTITPNTTNHTITFDSGNAYTHWSCYVATQTGVNITFS